MHSTLERATTPPEPDPPEVADEPSPVSPAVATHERHHALQAALRGLEDALAQRRSDPIHERATPPHHPRRTGAPRPQAVPLHRPWLLLGEPRQARRRNGADAARRVAVWLSRTLYTAGAALLVSLWALLMAAGRLSFRIAVRTTTTTAAVPLEAPLARPGQAGRRAEVAVAYPKRRPGSYEDRSLGDFIVPWIPMLASIAVMALIVTSYPNLISTLMNRSRAIGTATLSGRRLADAEQAASDAGLRVEVARVEPSESTPKDVIVEQDPRPGTRLEPGGTIRLVVSGGLRPPDVSGKTIDQARVDLIIRGWKPNPDVETRVAAGAPNVVIDQRPRATEAVPEKGPVTLIVAAPNLVLGRAVRTSVGGAAPEAVDGQTGTVAWPAGPAPGWLEIELGSPSTVAAVSLLPAVQRTIPAVVEVWAWDVSGRFYPLQAVAQDFADNQPVTARLSQPAVNVVRLRIATTSAGGPLGWREISVLDR